jgi:hypothetical protein
LQTYKRLNKSYGTLFGQRNIEEQENNEGEVERNTETFEARWGWVYNAELIKGFEGVSLNQVWELPIIQALNGLAYLKDKNQNERRQIEQMNSKYGKSVR